MRQMPSPTSRNACRLFLPDTFPKVAGPLAAYDEAPLSEEAATALMLFLKERLSDSDFAEAVRLGKGILDDAQAMDEPGPTPFGGMPTTNAQAMDQRRAALALRVARLPAAATKSFNERFPGAAKIRV